MIRRLARAQRSLPLLQTLAALALLLYGSATIEGFASTPSINTMLVLASLLGLASLGQTLVVIVGGIDLSVPGFVVAGAIAMAQLTSAEHWPFAVVLLAIVLGSGLVGGLVGWICHRYEVQPLVMTLAASFVVGGAAIAWTSTSAIGSVPLWLTRLASPATQTLGLDVPPLAVLWAVAAIAVGVVLRRTVAGRWIFATGANRVAAELTLVPTRRVWTLVFAGSAVASSLVGILLAGFAGAGSPSLGDPYLYQSLTAVVVGGTAFAGARGDYWHTVVGALLLTELTTILVGQGLSPAVQQMLFGVLILAVVAVYGRDKRLRDRV
jgi:ribose transport system permease protein